MPETDELFKHDQSFYDVKFEESDRIKQFKRKKRQVRIVAFFTVLLSLVVGYFLVFSSIANIRNIYITGDRLVSEEEVLELAEIKDYPNYYLAFKSSLRSKLISHEVIKDALIKKKGKAIYIEVIESKPILKVENGYLFDNNLILNYFFDDVVPYYHGDMEVISDVEFLDELNTLYGESYENYNRISEVIFNPHALNKKELRLIMRDGNTVIVSYDDFAYKMSYYVDILINISERMPDTTGIIDLVATIDCNEGCNYEFKPY
jgi:cell division protein FtsQ